LFEFEKGKVWKEHSRTYRFQCMCSTPADAMDIIVDSCGKDDEGKFITLSMYFLGTSLWDRIKYAFQILRGKWYWREFVLRDEDYGNLSEISDPGKKYSELP